MWSLYEFSNPGTGPFQKRGTIELNLEHVAVRQPPWKIALKLIATLGMIAIGMALIVPLIPLPPSLTIATAAFALFVYCVFAHYVRPEPNTDNMGWMGGMMNDPFQYNDNINRSLFDMHVLLGPGRFVAASVIDTLVTIGWLPERTEEHFEAQRELAATESREIREQEILERVEELQAQRPYQHTLELASARYLPPSDPPCESS